MPFPNEHSCRLESPNKYDEIRRVNNDIEIEGKKADAIYGILTKDGKKISELQAVRFPTETFTESESQNWCENNNGSFEKAIPEKQANFKIKAKLDISEIDIIGDIGDSWIEYNNNNTLIRIKNDLSKIKSNRIKVNLSSLGGDLMEGLSIYQILKAHPAKIEMNLIGANASASTIVAMAGDEINMPESSLFLVHNCWNLVSGNANDFRKQAAELDKFDEQMIKIYHEKTGKLKSEIYSLLEQEKWIDACEAKEWGFIDNIIESQKIAAKIDINKINDSKYLPKIKNQIKMDDKNNTLESLRVGLSDAQNKIKELETDGISNKGIQDSLKTQLNVSNTRISELNKEIAEKNKKLSEKSETSNEIVQAKVELGLKEKEIKSLQIQNESYKSQLDQVTNRLQATTNELNKLVASKPYSKGNDLDFDEEKSNREKQMEMNAQNIEI